MSPDERSRTERPSGTAGASAGTIWKTHRVRTGSHHWEDDAPPADSGQHRKHIEPWLAALLQAEHLSLLLGSGITTAVARLADAPIVDMTARSFTCDLAGVVDRAAAESARRSGRGTPNLEDQVRAARELIGGLRIMIADDDQDGLAARARDLLARWQGALDERLQALLRGVLQTERGIETALGRQGTDADRIRRILCSFLLTFASRTATRERLHVFTTNYDRIVEHGCDLLGLRVLDRFVGRLKPVFRASRLGIDLHYNPPGIRGEPRYLEGVVRLTKLHGSIDWRQEETGAGGPRIVRAALPFAASDDHPELPEHPRDGLIVYPNPAKDIETLEYPYAELFRDLAAAACQPNAVIVVYGYGFGDDHINRVLRDMLTIPSAHLAILSYDGASGRIERFVEAAGRDEQITLLLGDHFGDLATLVEHYLPKPAIDRTTWRMVDLLNRRTPHGSGEPSSRLDESEQGGPE
ncbi:MAG: fibronectin-binding protein (FBP) [Planctomycetota bacterium]|nr:MAG: fibronectin-binding protein (FBP) [Planctomycetota bacterium]